MEFSWPVSLISALVVVCEGAVSWSEKTFWPGQKGGKPIKLPFVLHGGVVIGDLFLLSYTYGIWAAYLHVPPWLWIIFFFVSLGITWFCHRAWWFMCEKQPGFMYPDRHRSKGDQKIWYHDLPISAWIHVAYMTVSLMLIGGYLYSPMSEEVVLRTFWIFFLFVPVAVIEPGIVQGWPPTKKDIMISIRVAYLLWVVVVVVTLIKMVHWFGF